MNPNNLDASGQNIEDAKLIEKKPSFSLEEITDKKMGLIQNCCASNVGKINFDDVV